MKKFQSFGVLTPEESEREKKHKSLARRAAAEGYVLLKNEGLLPLQNKNIALYGAGSRRTVKGGSGSGDVYERHSVTIEEGLKNAGFTFPTTLWMDRFEKKFQEDIAEWEAMVEEKIKGFSPVQSMKMFDVIHEYQKPNPACTPILEDELSDETDTAIYVLSRQAGEGGDRRYEKGDYLLSDVEEESLRLLSAHYKKLVLVLNCGSVIDLSILDQVRIDAVIFYAQGGMEGGNKFIPKELREQGFAVVAVNYRLSPKAKNPAYIEDAAEAVAWVFKNIEKYGGRKDHIFVSGHSAGGYLSLILAMDKKYMAAYGADADSVAAYLPVSGQTVTHFTIRKERGLPDGIPVVDEYAPVNKARKETAPLVLITGDKHLEMAARYEENALLEAVLKSIGNKKVTLYEMQGFDHGQVLGPACRLIADYVKRFK